MSAATRPPRDFLGGGDWPVSDVSNPDGDPGWKPLNVWSCGVVVPGAFHWLGC
ncbi:Uncharacterised protein [Mycobacteroides abscessus subsp. abscessus]|nr:Uncharacterised protein [Mycobacteroides abscessus subsp. abscessus]